MLLRIRAVEGPLVKTRSPIITLIFLLPAELMLLLE